VTLAEKTSPKTVADGSVQKASVIKGNGNGPSITVDGDGVHGSQLSFPGTDSTSATHVAKSTAPTPFAMRPNFSVRMTRRNALFAERKRLSDYALVFSVFGIVLMIIETELTMAHVYEKVNILLLLLRLLRHFFTPTIDAGLRFNYARVNAPTRARVPVETCLSASDWKTNDESRHSSDPPPVYSQSSLAR
jgi:Calcium-activated SK potassium channel